jgi:hypothetical protein
MKVDSRLRANIAVALLLSLIMLSCAHNDIPASQFQPQALSSSEKAIVYIYRPKGERAGWRRTFPLSTTSERLVDLRHGTYFAYEVDPGHLRLVVTTDSIVFPLAIAVWERLDPAEAATIDLDIAPGQTYYVRFRRKLGWSAPVLYLEPVEESVARRELTNCKVLSRGN